MRNVLFSLVALWLVSCTPQQRLNNLVSRHPELIRDSVHCISMQRILPGWKFDTILPFVRERQIPFNDDVHGITGVILIQNDSVALHIDKEPEPIHIDTAISVPAIVVKPTIKQKNNSFWLGALLCTGFFLLILIFTRR